MGAYVTVVDRGLIDIGAGRPGVAGDTAFAGGAGRVHRRALGGRATSSRCAASRLSLDNERHGDAFTAVLPLVNHPGYQAARRQHADQPATTPAGVYLRFRLLSS